MVLIGLWIWAEIRSDRPVVDMKMMRIPAVWGTNLAALLFGFGMFSMFIVAPEFVQTPTREATDSAPRSPSPGSILAPLALAMLLVAPSPDVSPGCRFEVACCRRRRIRAASYPSWPLEHSHQWRFYVASALLGVGVALGFASMANLIIEAVPASQTGVATGMNTNIRSIGGALGTLSRPVSSLLPFSRAVSRRRRASWPRL